MMILNISCKTCGGDVGVMFHQPNRFQSKTIIMRRVVSSKNNCKCVKKDRDWGKLEDILPEDL